MFVLIYFKYKKKNIRELNYNIRFKSFRALIFEKKKKTVKNKLQDLYKNFG